MVIFPELLSNAVDPDRVLPVSEDTVSSEDRVPSGAEAGVSSSSETSGAGSGRRLRSGFGAVSDAFGDESDGRVHRTFSEDGLKNTT